MTDTAKLFPLSRMAARLSVKPAWLRAEVAAGRLPAVEAGTTLLFDPALIEELLLERARGTTPEDRREERRRRREARRARAERIFALLQRLKTGEGWREAAAELAQIDPRRWSRLAGPRCRACDSPRPPGKPCPCCLDSDEPEGQGAEEEQP